MPTERMWDEASQVGRYLGPVDPTPPGFRPEGERVVARAWKALVAQGLVWIGVGALVLSWPDPTLETLAGLTAALAFAHGATSGACAITGAIRRGGRAWLALDAVTAIVVGLVLLAWPGLSTTSMLYVLGAWAVALGILQTIGAHVLPLSGERATLLAWSGLVPITFGVAMLVRSSDGALASTSLIAAFAIATGALQIASALDLRAVGRRALG